MEFEFATAGRIRFGDGTAAELAGEARAHGERALVVVGSDLARTAPLRAQLDERGLACTVLTVPGEPTVELAERGVALARAERIQVVIAIGGGSAIDAGKAVAALATNAGAPLDYLEVIGAGRALTERSLPFLAVPTTAGTGAEVTRNAVLASKAHGVKVSLRSPLMLPALALVDPVLTHSMPPSVTAASGLDAFTQVLEPFVSNRSNAMTDALCRDGITRAARSLRRAYAHGDDAEARRDMALTSLFGGLALANARLGAVHGIAGPLGGMFEGAPHGAVCARLLPAVVEANVRALLARAPGSKVLARYDEVARLSTGRRDATVDDLVGWLNELVSALAIPPLSAYGVTEAAFDALAERAQRASSTKGNPIELTREELLAVLARAI